MILQPSLLTGAEREVPEVAREDLQVIFYSIMSNISISSHQLANIFLHVRQPFVNDDSEMLPEDGSI